MARLARVVLPGHPHHIIQRGNRRQDVFFHDNDYEYYLELLKRWCDLEGVSIWAYCLMTNHVHLIVVPKKKSNLAKAIGETHRRYTRMINFREGWKGYLWQGRFASYPMDEQWLLKAAAYIELNPVKAGMVKKAWEHRWSSVHAHLSGFDKQGIIQPEKLLSLTGDWKEYLQQASRHHHHSDFERHERTGRPLGEERFIEKAERLLGRNLKKKRPGPKTKDDSS
ncbi:MAG: transposase [Gammaproteobacteria bacterium]|nr:MAG: transposase [Gammaproteobacteria bacterium]